MSELHLRSNRETGATSLTRSVTLASGDGQGFLVIRPVQANKGIAGYLAGVLRFRRLVGDTLDEQFSERYMISILEDGQLIYVPPGWDPISARDWAQDVALTVLNRTWRLRVAPTPAALADSRSSLADTALAAGLLFSLLLASVLLLARTARVRASIAEGLFAQLATEAANRKQLEEERERFFALSPDVLCAIGPDGCIRQINAAGEQLLGLRAGGEKDLRELAHPADGYPLARVDLEQVLLTLTLNAREAMPDGGRISITVTRLETPDTMPGSRSADERTHQVVIAVSDTGRGMPPAVRSRALEPFFTTKDIGQGSGMGLSAVHGMVRRAGGFVAVASTPGCGSTIRLHLPLDVRPSGGERG